MINQEANTIIVRQEMKTKVIDKLKHILQSPNLAKQYLPSPGKIIQLNSESGQLKIKYPSRQTKEEQREE